MSKKSSIFVAKVKNRHITQYWSVSAMHGADSSWADPLMVDISASLEHNIDHVLTTQLVLEHLNAALLPSVDHLILADPVARKHHAVVRWIVQIDDVLQAELDVLVHAAQG